MKSEELQRLTASEPLTLEQEYSMQQSWREDADSEKQKPCAGSRGSLLVPSLPFSFPAVALPGPQKLCEKPFMKNPESA